MTTLSAPAAVSIRDNERASADDTELQSVRQFVKTGDAAHLPWPYLPLRYELTTIGQVVLCGTRIVPLVSLRSQILQLAHEGHQGIVKQKSDSARRSGGQASTTLQSGCAKPAPAAKLSVARWRRRQ